MIVLLHKLGIPVFVPANERFDFLYDQRGNAIPEKMDQMLREIDMGIWDNCLIGNYEIYRNAKAQIEMSSVFQLMAATQQQSGETFKSS